MFFCPFILLAQRQATVGFSAGATTYFGDLGNEKYVPLSSVRPGMMISIRNFMSNPAKTGVVNPLVTIEARFSHHRIGYDETKSIGKKSGHELQNFGRGLSFRNDILGFSMNGILTRFPERHKSLYSSNRPAFYVFAGIGVYYSNPKADLFNGDLNLANRYYFWNDGSIRNAPESSGKGDVIKKDGVYETTLSDWHTEGQGGSIESGSSGFYDNCHLALPFGIGTRMAFSKNLILSMELSFYNFNTDFLDDVSTSYATYQSIREMFPNDPDKQALAQYISDPTGKGTNGEAGVYTSQRGNPGKNDLYSYLGIELAYKLVGKTSSKYKKLLF